LIESARRWLREVTQSHAQNEFPDKLTSYRGQRETQFIQRGNNHYQFNIVSYFNLELYFASKSVNSKNHQYRLELIHNPTSSKHQQCTYDIPNSIVK